MLCKVLLNFLWVVKFELLFLLNINEFYWMKIDKIIDMLIFKLIEINLFCDVGGFLVFFVWIM